MNMVKANNVDFAILEWGDPAAPLALCLHGFPDSAHTYRFLGPALASAGYHVVAPFLRGYAPTAVPDDGHYQTGAYVADAQALHDVLGGDERAVLIGHDLGAMAAYGCGALTPQRWRRVVTIAVAPPGTPGNYFSYQQLRRIWYMFFFQTPGAEQAVIADDLDFVAGLWSAWSPSYDASDDLVLVKPSLADPANALAAISFYRAIQGNLPADPALEAEQEATGRFGPQPHLYLHGAEDGCVGIENTYGAEDLLPAGSQVHRFDGAGHFLHLERADEVNSLITDFMAS